MELNIVGIIAATVAQFIFGFIWYGPVFGKIWGQIHGFDKLSKEVQQKLMKEMGPFYILQVVVTVVTTVVLSVMLSSLPSWNPYILAGLLWLGFVLPTQVSAVVFGGTEKKWMFPKIAIQSGAALVCIMLASLVLSLLKF